MSDIHTRRSWQHFADDPETATVDPVPVVVVENRNVDALTDRWWVGLDLVPPKLSDLVPGLDRMR